MCTLQLSTYAYLWEVKSAKISLLTLGSTFAKCKTLGTVTLHATTACTGAADHTRMCLHGNITGQATQMMQS